MSILGVAYSGLNAFQYALDVTANNISNSTTKGYSKQSILLAPSAAQRYGNAYVGTGVRVDSIYRTTDQFAVNQTRSMLSIKSQYDLYSQQAAKVDQILSQDASSISNSLQAFYDAFNQLNNSPNSAPARGVALSQSSLLVQQFNFMQSNLDGLSQNCTTQLTAMANEINTIGANLVSLNTKLMSDPNSPELLDQRDQLLMDLAQYTDITSSINSNGTVNVGFSTGAMLVVGPNQRTLSVQYDPTTTYGAQVFLGEGISKIDISSQLTTGKLGGLMDYQHKVIANTSQTIGLMAIGLAQTVNAQNKLGMDLNNQLGQNIFNDFNAANNQIQRSVPSANNTGTGVLSVAIADLSKMQVSDYHLVIDDIATNQLHLVRESDGQVTPLTWSSNPPAPPAGQIEIDGMTITVDDLSNLANNDTYKLMPTRGAARDLNLLVNDPNLFALAAPVKTSPSLNNMGTGACNLGTVFNTTNVTTQYSIEFISPTQFNVIDVASGTTLSGPVPFVPNSNNEVQIPDALNPSYSVILSGVPNSGDQFNLEYNTGGYGDNRNGLMLAGIQNAQIFDGGNKSLLTSYSDLLSDIGGDAKQATNRAAAFDVLYRQALNFQESQSGVNLDEEAQNLLRFEQAYAAAGKLVEVSSRMMQILFEMMR